MSSSIDQGSLPVYASPPVVETILGVQFDRLPGFRNAHLGAFWKTLDVSKWPTVADAPPLQPQFERFDEAAAMQWGKGSQLQLTAVPPGRVQITNQEGNRMIQVQNGRLHFNWLGQNAPEYVRYANIRAGFEDVLNDFLRFADAEKVGKFQPNQWEVTYLNHIPRGTVWNTPADWNFFSLLSGIPRLDELVEGESFDGEWHFVIPEKRGRLHIQWRHGVKHGDDEQEIIVLTLTARGPISGASPASILEGLDVGHNTIVRGFEALMSDTANEYWGLEHARN
jgi:uncharacterized protein (TIGR04255 family)